ncbi:MAG: 16S rRNA (adenine(1518)-N(6)/adenine(1519)-N(6))-dimethyltransferase RsmA [Clostridia bacterium]|nr:16S rRNA (adenine(1518)-N(6)/adenine(1519)-N(6))-dimethyltransferase RsmA [Clostridia bacterium]
MNLIQETNFIMKKYNIVAQKSYGQNFLINEEIIHKIINQTQITKSDLVIEIGPGLGNLTSRLLEVAGKVVAIELDPKMINVLNNRFSLYDNFEIINEDILKVNIDNIIGQNSRYQNFKVVANLPYYITTPIIMKLLEEKSNLTSITVMVQKEVAERLNSLNPNNHQKDIGAISYAVKYYSNSEIIINVPKSDFIPIPKVDSAVIKLDVLSSPSVKVSNEKLLFKIIKASYMQKRKTLVNSLVNGKIIDKDTLLMILEKLNIDSRIRPEQLTLEDFANITNSLCN